MMNGNLPSKSRLKIMSVLIYDLGASVSTILKSLCDVLGLTDIEECSLNLHLADSTIKNLWEELMMFLFLQIGIMCP